MNSQNCESRDDTAASRLQDIIIGRRCIHCRRKTVCIPFSVVLVTEHKVLDALDDIFALVGHLQIEIDVGHAQFLAVHAGNEILDVLGV